MSEHLLWDGQQCAAPGLDIALPGTQHGWTWRAGECRVGLRSEPIRLVVIHATDGEGNAAQVHRTLTAKRLSVEFVIERDGRVYQFLDPARYHGAHCGGLNAESIGIEVVCRLDPHANQWGRPESSQIVQVVDPTAKWHRSNRRACLGLLAPQVVALTHLVDCLCSHAAIPATLADQRDYIPPNERGALRGVVGHAQVTTKHGDPPLDALAPFRGTT